jgi:hypothetical protein
MKVNQSWNTNGSVLIIDTQFVEIPTVVPDGWCSVMSTDDYLPWVLVDELLVKSLGLTKAYDTF